MKERHAERYKLYVERALLQARVNCLSALIEQSENNWRYFDEEDRAAFNDLQGAMKSKEVGVDDN